MAIRKKTVKTAFQIVLNKTKESSIIRLIHLCHLQNLTPNSPSKSFNVMYFGVTGKATGD